MKKLLVFFENKEDNLFYLSTQITIWILNLVLLFHLFDK